jgi:hypothetical protein
MPSEMSLLLSASSRWDESTKQDVNMFDKGCNFGFQLLLLLCEVDSLLDQ